MSPKKTLCVAGPTEPECGTMHYHGDSSGHAIGKTTEAISIDTIGEVDYLIYLNREVASDVASSFVNND